MCLGGGFYFISLWLSKHWVSTLGWMHLQCTASQLMLTATLGWAEPSSGIVCLMLFTLFLDGWKLGCSQTCSLKSLKPWSVYTFSLYKYMCISINIEPICIYMHYIYRIKLTGFIYTCMFVCVWLCVFICKSTQTLPQVLHYIPIVLMQYRCVVKRCLTVGTEAQ